MSNDQYRYHRNAFGPLPAKLEHLDIYLNFLDGKVHGTNTIRMTALEQLSELRLDAKELRIISVELVEGREAYPLSYDYRHNENSLIIQLPGRANGCDQDCSRPALPGRKTDTATERRGYTPSVSPCRAGSFQPGDQFTIRTVTECVPSDTILEGIYKDTTPPGCPQQYMSQFQQWGFQRVMPILDDCRAKCTMTTTLEADARYTHLISNGDVDRSRNPDGKPVPKPGDPSRQVITYVNRIPMAPYLFIACVGTWDVLEDYVTYPSGRRVRLEYLVPPGRKAGAVVPMQILKDSVLWQGRSQNYEYQREAYRTICMEKSNFGGMENVGNTTIITDAALVDEFTNDSRILYAHCVIVHEFEHNQCGSDVTMETPFDVWLNEAFTVDVERQFMHEQFDPDSRRLDEIASMRAPIGGPLAIEDAGHHGRIVREAFNDPDELIDGVTYVKAAEVIRMLRHLLGADTFRRAKDLYFDRYRGGNANTDQFFACFEETSGRDLSQFKKEWLFTIGYPRVKATYEMDPAHERIRLSLQQSRSGKGGLFHVPVDVAVVDPRGCEVPGTSRTLELTGIGVETAFEKVPPGSVLSLNRGCSFYGTFEDASATADDLVRLIRLDTDGVNRVEAMRRLTDLERIRLMRDPGASVGEAWLDVYGSLLRDEHLPPGLKASFLAIDEQSLDRTYMAWYRERYAARQRLLKAVAARWRDPLRASFEAVDTYRKARSPKDGIEDRRLKAVLLRGLIETGARESWELAEQHYRNAWSISDKLAGLVCVYLSRHPGRMAVMDEAFESWKDHLSAYTSYLTVVGGGATDDVFDRLAVEEKRSAFRLAHPTHNRSLFLPMAANNKLLWTDRGIAWMREAVLRLAPANERSAYQLVGCFQLVGRLADDLKPKVTDALRAMLAGIDPARHPSLHGRVKEYLGK